MGHTLNHDFSSSGSYITLYGEYDPENCQFIILPTNNIYNLI